MSLPGTKKRPAMNTKIVQPVPQAGQTQEQPIAKAPDASEAARSEEAEKERIKALTAKGRQSTIASSNLGVTEQASVGVKRLMGA